RLASYNAAEATGLLTLDRLVHLYLKEGLHGRSSKHRRETKQRLKLVVGFLGGDREVRSLTPSDVERYKEARLSGSVRPAGRKQDGGVRYGTVWHDLVALSRALNWAVGHRDARGRQLLAANPLAGVRLPREASPARPVADQGRYLALKAVAPRIGPSFGLALTLAFETGH